MKRWPRQALRDFCITGSGGTPSRGKPQYFKDGSVPWVKSGELKEAVVATTEERITVEATRETNARIVPRNAVLVAMYGATVGKTAILGIEAATNQAICHIVPDPAKADFRFVWYALRGRLDELLSKRIGGAQPNINQGILRDTMIPLPPLPEQEQIVRLLDEAEELRKLRAQADRRSATLIPALFHEMFGDPEAGSPNWPITTVGEVCNLVRGSSPRPKSDPRYYGGPIPRLTIEDITRDGWLVTPRVDSLTELGATMSRPVKAGTIVMAVSGNIGLCAELAVDACVHDGFVAFKDLRSRLFVGLFFGMALGLMRRVHLRNRAGAIFQNITTTDVKAMKVPVPPLSLQEDSPTASAKSAPWSPPKPPAAMRRKPSSNPSSTAPSMATFDMPIRQRLGRDQRDQTPLKAGGRCRIGGDPSEGAVWEAAQS